MEKNNFTASNQHEQIGKRNCRGQQQHVNQSKRSYYKTSSERQRHTSTAINASNCTRLNITPLTSYYHQCATLEAQKLAPADGHIM